LFPVWEFIHTVGKLVGIKFASFVVSHDDLCCLLTYSRAVSVLMLVHFSCNGTCHRLVLGHLYPCVTTLPSTSS
jgi:hypothetical protein